ncbi:MAG: general secretion pathway protein GspB [Candidatus Omnitrophica bacterium]|nr:general secretion pathway protein GspB [Candidatus Omnitrophota bacterium]
MKNTSLIVLFITIFLLSLYSLGQADVVSSKKVAFKPSGLRSPFRSLLPEKKAEEAKEVIKAPEREIPVSSPKVKINGIVWGGLFPQAIINDEVTREGDVLGKPESITVLEIKPREVVVLFKGKIFSLNP